LECPSVDMLPFGVTIPASVPQRSEIPEGLMNYCIIMCKANCMVAVIALECTRQSKNVYFILQLLVTRVIPNHSIFYMIIHNFTWYQIDIIHTAFSSGLSLSICEIMKTSVDGKEECKVPWELVLLIVSHKQLSRL
jgi:hypothetical protein